MRNLATLGAILFFLAVPSLSLAQQAAAQAGLQAEGSLPDRYPYVVQDVLKHATPKKGFWVDLGAGRGQVAIPLIEATGNPVVMVDPESDSLAAGLEAAQAKGLADRLFPVVGVAEHLPFPDGSVDLVVSRGSIFFWDDPAGGLREVYRVLRPGGKAYIGGGTGSGYPKAAAGKLIEGQGRSCIAARPRSGSGSSNSAVRSRCASGPKTPSCRSSR